MTGPKYSTAPQTSCKYIRNVSAFANALADAFHCVIADRASKAPIREGWLDRPATAEEVAAALDDPDLVVGHVPAAAGLLVIDVDKPGWVDAVEESLKSPLCTVRTRRGWHLYYRSDERLGNISWEGGEVRSGSGYAILWQPDAVLAAMESLGDYGAVNTAKWPLNVQERPTSARSSPQRRASRPSRSLEKGLRLALERVPCWRLTRDEWLDIGRGLHHAEGIGLIEDGLSMWIEHSKMDWRRYHEGECGAKWRGFAVDPPGKRPKTHRSIFALAKRFGYRPSKYRRRKPIRKWGTSDDPDLNGRQSKELDYLYSKAKTERESRKDGLLVQVRQGDVAHLMDCSTKTVGRDFAHLQHKGRMLEVGKPTVRHETGGHSERSYELIPVNNRHQKRRENLTPAVREAWDQVMQSTRQQDVEMDTPFGTLVTIGGRLHKVLPDILTGGRPLLVPLEQERGPPEPD